MTAIKTRKDDSTAGGIDLGAASEHPKNRSSRRKGASNGPKKPLGGSSVSAARERFAVAVSRGVEELTGRGYSRERAAALLLGEIRMDDGPPCDNEVFRAMERCRMGMEEAAKTVTVARALRRTRTEKGLSAVDAIDDLTSKLDISSLVMKVEAESSSFDGGSGFSSVGDKYSDETLASPLKELSTKGGESGGGCSIASRSNSSPPKTTSQRTMKCVRSTPVRNVSPKAPGRKRSLSGCEDSMADTTRSGKERKNEVDLSSEAKLADKENDLSDSAARCKSPTATMIRTKRGSVHRGEDQQLLAQQPALKRTRADS